MIRRLALRLINWLKIIISNFGEKRKFASDFVGPSIIFLVLCVVLRLYGLSLTAKIFLALSIVLVFFLVIIAAGKGNGSKEIKEEDKKAVDDASDLDNMENAANLFYQVPENHILVLRNVWSSSPEEPAEGKSFVNYYTKKEGWTCVLRKIWHDPVCLVDLKPCLRAGKKEKGLTVTVNTRRNISTPIRFRIATKIKREEDANAEIEKLFEIKEKELKRKEEANKHLADNNIRLEEYESQKKIIKDKLEGEKFDYALAKGQHAEIELKLANMTAEEIKKHNELTDELSRLIKLISNLEKQITDLEETIIAETDYELQEIIDESDLKINRINKRLEKAWIDLTRRINGEYIYLERSTMRFATQIHKGRRQMIEDQLAHDALNQITNGYYYSWDDPIKEKKKGKLSEQQSTKETAEARKKGFKALVGLNPEELKELSEKVTDVFRDLANKYGLTGEISILNVPLIKAIESASVQRQVASIREKTAASDKTAINELKEAGVNPTVAMIVAGAEKFMGSFFGTPQESSSTEKETEETSKEV